jgi:cytochrome b pre-mRNA-processing protein 3
MDRGLREMGTGDLSVGRHVKRMAQSFYGRIRAYQDGLERSDGALGAALARNVFGTVGESAPTIEPLVDYVRRAARLLAQQSAAELLAGDPGFPLPDRDEANARPAVLARSR